MCNAHMAEGQRPCHQTSKQEVAPCNKVVPVSSKKHPKQIPIQEHEYLAGWLVCMMPFEHRESFLHGAHLGHESHAQINKETRPLFFPSPTKAKKTGSRPLENIMAAITT